MKSIKLAFTVAAATNHGSGTFWLLIWVIAILDDSKRRAKQRRKCQRLAQPQGVPKVRPPAGPRPF